MTKTGHTYNPQETRDAEQKYVEAAGENYPIFDGPIKVEMSFFEDRTYIKIISLPDWGKRLRQLRKISSRRFTKSRNHCKR